jgi:16S rRNA (guanine(966)-N(2))-methyltransferase RsmD
MEDVIFIDLFAGTGSVGLEALSHGARHIYLVEHDPQALRTLFTNIRHCDAVDAVTVITASLPGAVRRLPQNVQADILFLDPPYASNLGEMTLAALEGHSVLAPHSTLIWQHAAQQMAPSEVLQLPLWQSRRYGNTQLSFYTRQNVSL